MKKASFTLILSCIIAVFLTGQTLAAPLTPVHWSSSYAPGLGSSYVPAGTWSETIVSTGPYDDRMLGSHGSMTANDVPVPPYPLAVSAMNPVWQMTTYTRTACSVDNYSQNGYIVTGDYKATYEGNWVFKTPTTLYPSFTYDTYHVTGMKVTVSYHLVFNAFDYTYTLSNMTWNGEGPIDENHGYKFTLYAEGSEKEPRDPFTNVHSGVLTLAEGTVSAVPVPGAVWLLGTGLLGLLGFRRKLGR